MKTKITRRPSPMRDARAALDDEIVRLGEAIPEIQQTAERVRKGGVVVNTPTHDTIVGTCGVCERDIAVDPKGRLVAHGYRRPGDGKIHGNCFAVGYEPYERSLTATNAWRAIIDGQRTRAVMRMRQFHAGEVKRISRSEHRYDGGRLTYVVVEYHVDQTEPRKWRELHAEAKAEAESTLKQLEREIERLDRLIRDWKLEELTTETRAGRLRREQAEAAKAIKAKAKADREAAEAAKKAKAAALEVQKAEKKAKLLEEALAGIRAAPGYAAAFKVARRWVSAARKTPRVHYSYKELEADEVFDVLVPKDLATRHQDGYKQLGSALRELLH